MALNQKTSSALGPRQAATRDYSIGFTASGSEYFRIWIVNLLLIIVTFGIYMPWAKVRKLRYFYSNTQVDGHALDFHGKAAQMLRGSAIAWVFLVVYSMAANMSGWAGLIAAVVFVGLWPMLFRSSMRFRLANTSWRGLRFHFTGDERGAYQAIMPPMALFIIPFALIAALVDPEQGRAPKLPGSADAALGVLFVLFLAALPYFLWRVKSYQHGNYAFGQLRSEFRCKPGAFYGVMFRTFGVALLGVAIFVAGFFLLAKGSGGLGMLVSIPLFLATIFFFNIVPKAYAQSQLQNLVWSRTGNSSVRFVSELAFGRYARLQFRNFLLILVTLGLYWPFAVVASRRAQLQAVTLRSRVDLDDIAGAGSDGQAEAAGDAAADMFGLDIGM